MSFLIYLLVVVAILIVVWIISARMDNIARDKVNEWKVLHNAQENALVDDYKKYVRVSIKEVFRSRKKKNK